MHYLAFRFTSSYTTPDKRLGAILKHLSYTRIGVSIHTTTLLINALTIAIRYSIVRKQFWMKDMSGPETSLIEYPAIQHRIMTYLSAGLVQRIAGNQLWKQWDESVKRNEAWGKDSHTIDELQALTCVIKALNTTMSQKGIQEMREICGGLGYHSISRIGEYRTGNDVNLTWEGDNNLMLMQAARFVLQVVSKANQDYSKVPPVSSNSDF
jgi:acyl-CoA oxidase